MRNGREERGEIWKEKKKGSEYNRRGRRDKQETGKKRSKVRW